MNVIINDLLADLNARLPELEWKINGLSAAVSRHSVPRGLFRAGVELTGQGCVDEIKADIQVLAQQKNERGALFLAERIKQKVNVLVALCQIDSRKKKPEAKVHFGVNMLSTRQQWISGLEENINILSQQQQAMTNSLQQMKRNENHLAILALQAELGEVERRLTLAKETLNQAIL